jgi:histidyl-tRNA synthetase
MAKVKNISGFPEWLPSERRLEESLLSAISSQYQLHGFTPIETPSVELLTTLFGNGVEEKEIYAVNRAHAGEDDDASLGLHFDLTVPFARFIAQHHHALTFPFKRGSLQKVWRGDRPQRGRFREFYQCDIDIVARDTLPLSADAEVVEVIDKTFCAIGLPPHTVRINNRKILQGFYEGLGVSDDVCRRIIVEVDKLDKVGESGVRRCLSEVLALTDDVINEILVLARLEVPISECESALEKWRGKSALFDEGISELRDVCALLPDETKQRSILDGSLARGLFYYTGIIFEIRFPDYPEFGSLGGGGRYEGLTERFGARGFPCVGGSIGLTRLFSMILEHSLLPLPSSSPTKVLVTVMNEETRRHSMRAARELRSYGVATEVFFKSPKLGKQIEYAVAKGIRYVLFLNEEGSTCDIKDLSKEEQKSIPDLKVWVSETFV